MNNVEEEKLKELIKKRKRENQQEIAEIIFGCLIFPPLVIIILLKEHHLRHERKSNPAFLHLINILNQKIYSGRGNGFLINKNTFVLSESTASEIFVFCSTYEVLKVTVKYKPFLGQEEMVYEKWIDTLQFTEEKQIAFANELYVETRNAIAKAAGKRLKSRLKEELYY